MKTYREFVAEANDAHKHLLASAEHEEGSRKYHEHMAAYHGEKAKVAIRKDYHLEQQKAHEAAAKK
jgi:hypothetical protein